MTYGKVPLPQVTFPHVMMKRTVGEGLTYRKGSGVSFLTEATWWSGVATTSTRSPILSDASTVVFFSRGMRMFVPSVDFTTTSSLVSITTSPRTRDRGVAWSDCESAGDDMSKTPIAASTSRKDCDTMRDLTVAASEMIASMVAA